MTGNIARCPHISVVMEHRDEDNKKGAVEQDSPEQKTNVAPLSEQLDHQYQDSLNKMSDTDFPEPGQNEEHSGSEQGGNQLDRDTAGNTETCDDPDGTNPEGIVQDQDPGHRQKQNQNKKKDDDLAA